MCRHEDIVAHGSSIRVAAFKVRPPAPGVILRQISAGMKLITIKVFFPVRAEKKGQPVPN